MLSATRHRVYWFAGLMGIVLSYWASLRAGVINPDAVCYLQSAQSMSMGVDFAAHLCEQARWPFYSLLIFSITKITHLSYINAAYLIDSFFSLISVIAFIVIVDFFKKSTRIRWFAALTILLSHEFNAVREYIVRDHGFWAFYLVSILCLLKFSRTEQLRYALAWSASLAVAMLFRIEGLAFLLLLPLGSLFSLQIKAFLKLNTLMLFACAILVVVLFLYPEILSKLSRINELFYQLQNGVSLIVQHFQQSANALVQHVLSPFAARDANNILLLMLLSWYVVNVIGNLSLIYAVLVAYAWIKKLLPVQHTENRVLWGYILISVVITAGFLVQQMFLSKRYLLALSLTLMLWVPFALDKLAERWQQRKWPLILAIFLMLIASLGGIFDFGYSKKYMSDAGNWLAAHTSTQDRIYSNSAQVMYYSQHFGNAIFARIEEQAKMEITANKQWMQYDYVVLRFNKRNQSSIENAKIKKALGEPVQIFQNKRGDAVNIYHIKQIGG